MPENGESLVELDVYDFKGPGVALAMYNIDQVFPFYIITNKYYCELLIYKSSWSKFSSLFEHLLNHQCQWHFQRSGLFTWAPKIQFWRNMMAGLLSPLWNFFPIWHYNFRYPQSMVYNLNVIFINQFRFKDIFEEVYQKKWKHKFEEHSIWLVFSSWSQLISIFVILLQLATLCAKISGMNIGW